METVTSAEFQAIVAEVAEEAKEIRRERETLHGLPRHPKDSFWMDHPQMMSAYWASRGGGTGMLPRVPMKQPVVKEAKKPSGFLEGAVDDLFAMMGGGSVKTPDEYMEAAEECFQQSYNIQHSEERRSVLLRRAEAYGALAAAAANIEYCRKSLELQEKFLTPAVDSVNHGSQDSE